MTEYLTLVEVLAIHDQLISRFGGQPGVRDGGSLEAALFRPQTGYYDDVIGEAAAFFESLLVNHPFVDGNKRTAFAATDVFLRLNGVTLKVHDERAYEFIMDWLAQPSRELEDVRAWLRSSAGM